MDSQNHLDLFVSDDYCWVAGDIIDKSNYIIVGFLYGLLLGLYKVDQGDQHCGIHCQVII